MYYARNLTQGSTNLQRSAHAHPATSLFLNPISPFVTASATFFAHTGQVVAAVFENTSLLSLKSMVASGQDLVSKVCSACSTLVNVTIQDDV